ncbi:MAG: type 1 glutamine amidotransferase [Candidatus Aminicenantes bacterium]|nr:type 1 glutamine amidotransferase [Candidatus Aminicenantes bacterium]
MLKKNNRKIAIIDNSIDESLYRPTEHWGAYLEDVSWHSFRAKYGKLPVLEKYTHLLLTGSEASILERDKWVEEEVSLVREAVNRGMAVLGSCYGHQLLALALKGPDSIGRCLEPEIGWYLVTVKENNTLLGEKGVLYSFSIHFDEVVSLDDSFQILAETEKCRIQAFQLTGKPVWGLQIHPEINPVQAREILQFLSERQTGQNDLYTRALAMNPLDSGIINQIIKTFLLHDSS